MTVTSLLRARRQLYSYWAIAAIHLVAVAFDLKAIRLLSKVTLMPSLASWVREQQGSPLLIAAILASAVGDLLMELDWLVPAMAAFAVAHACYIAVFSRGTRRRSWIVPTVYCLLGLSVMVAFWPGLGLYRAPVAAYATMLMATAVTSLWYGGRAGVGGALFLASDTMICAKLAGYDFPLRTLLLKTAYGAGQYQIAVGLTGGASARTLSQR
ncbi:lysoplasmalogenase family protein [Kribbella sp. NPDC051620]|uniref:lysoplasmalogenase family protein n=1 Tax=Kribbella sp. NPDC051620 TaxID=3364120 RepID=UPI0037B915A9